MKLIVEVVDSPVTSLIEETVPGVKKMFIEGVFMQADTPNRNGRIYPKSVMTEGLQRYNNEFVIKKRAVGELGHPETATVNLERVSHLITQLEMRDKDVYGKALLLDTPFGNIAKGFLQDGVQLGVSSRALGSVVKRNGLNEVKSDFRLAAVDIVADPSAPEAFVQGILEGKEWIYNNGQLVEQELEQLQTQITNKGTKDIKLFERELLENFYQFLSKL